MICPEKLKLTDELAGVMKRILELHGQRSAALIAGEASAPATCEAELEQAQSRRAALLTALKAHAQDHGC